MKLIKSLTRSSLLKETLIYGLSNALYSGLPLLLMPFLVAILSPEDYGTADLFRSITLVLTPVLGLSTVQSIGRFYFDLSSENFKRFYTSIVLLHFINSIVFCGLLSITAFFIDEQYTLICFLAIIFVLFNQITEALLVIYRVNSRPKKYLIIRIGSVVLDLGVLVIFYFAYDTYDWTYRVIPNVISMVFVGWCSLFVLFKSVGYKVSIDKGLIKTAMIYSTPLIIHMVANHIINVGDRFLILHYLGEGELGNYSVAYQLGLFINFFYTSFNLSWTPTFYRLLKEGQVAKIRQIKKIVFLSLPILGIGLICMWLALSRVIDNFSNYSISIHLIIVICVSYIISSFYKFNVNYLFYEKRTKRLSLYTLVTAGISVILNVLLLPKIGVIGAAYSTLVSFCLLYLFIDMYRRKLEPNK